MSGDPPVNLNLSAAELIVLAEELDLDPRFAVGDRSEQEMTQMKQEGWRSLLVRRLVRLEDGSVSISTDLVLIAEDVLAPVGLLTYTSVSGEEAQMSHVLVGRRGMLDTTPIADDVAMYSSIGADDVVRSIVIEVDSAEVDTVHRLESIDGLSQRSAGVVTWVQTADGTVLVDTEDGAEETTIDTIRDSVAGLVAGLEKPSVVESPDET